MSGTVRQRDGRWEYRYDAGRDPVTGRRLRPGRSGFTTRDAAQAALRDAERAQHDVTRHLDSNNGAALTVLAYLTRWLTTIAGTIRPSTWTSYNTYVAAHIAPAIGALPLNALKADHLNRFYEHLLEGGRARSDGGLSPKTVTNIHRMLHRALAGAIADGLLAPEVLQSASPPPVPDRAANRWSTAELARFLDHIRGERLRALWLVVLSTDLDRRELISLRHDHLDLRAGCIVRHGEQHQLDEQTSGALREHLAKSTEERTLLGLSTHLVFTHPDGRPLQPHRITVWFNQLCRDAALPQIHLPELRLSYAAAFGEAADELDRGADQEAANTMASLIVRPTGGRESGREWQQNGSTENEEPSDHLRFRRSEGTSPCSGGRI